MNMTPKQKYKLRKEELKIEYKKAINELRFSYKNRGMTYATVLYHIYVRKIYFKVTLANIKRDGLARFIWRKLFSEVLYRYWLRNRSKSITYPCYWKWPKGKVSLGNNEPIESITLRNAEKFSEILKTETPSEGWGILRLDNK